MVENSENLQIWGSIEKLSQVESIYDYRYINHKISSLKAFNWQKDNYIDYESWPNSLAYDYKNLKNNYLNKSTKIEPPEGLTEQEHEQGILLSEDQDRLRLLLTTLINQSRPELRLIEKPDDLVGSLKSVELIFYLQNLNLAVKDLSLNHLLRAISNNYDKTIDIKELAKYAKNQISRNAYYFFPLAEEYYLKLFNETVVESIDLMIRGVPYLDLEDFLIDLEETIISPASSIFPTPNSKNNFMIKTQIYDCKNNFDWLGYSNLGFIGHYKLQSANHKQASARLTLSCYGDLQIKKNKRKLFL